MLAALRMDETAPAPRYYTSLVGAWEGRFRIRITSRPELARLPLATRFIGNAAHLAGAMSMKTTLDGEGRSFRHTTHVSAFGLEQFTTDEAIELDSDGRTFRMSGVQRPRVGKPETYDAHGSIDETATRATYELTWLGCPLVQRTRIVTEGLELTQDTSWSHGEVLLARRR
jgi:hypothetical protein